MVILTGRTENDEFLSWLTDECLYLNARRLPDGRYAAIYPLIYTHRIITVRAGDFMSYDDGWCYHDHGSAKAALDAWDGTGEPEGWHRHPASGRRREDGDPDREEIRP
jgi:hypothetical protein